MPVAFALPIVVVSPIFLVIETRDRPNSGCGTWDALPAVVAGMPGAGISGLRRLRDELLRLTEMEAFLPAYAAQLVIGAGFGLAALLPNGVFCVFCACVSPG